jgi:phospholipid/cholesterol/gamma-HCH transport system substrate-binding protein
MISGKKLAFRVGLLAALAIAVGFLVLASIGQTGRWFRKQVTFHSAFANVAGLAEGAPVRLGGREVGDVTRIEFGPIGDQERALIVTYEIRADFADRVREDSTARIGSLGLLGDKVIELDVGSETSPVVPPDGWVRGETPSDASQLLTVATQTAEHARDILSKVDDMVEKGIELEDVKELVASLRRITQQIETGPGGLHEVIFGPHLPDAIDSLAASANAVRKVFLALNLTTPAPDVIVDSAKAAQAVDRLLGAIDPESVNRSTKALAQAAENAASVTADVRAGRGSLGGFLEDPTIYEETKRMLVSINRNAIVKALVRFVIRRRDASEVPAGNPDEVVVHPRPGPRTHGEAVAPTKTRNE